MTEFQAITRKNQISVRKFISTMQGVGVDFSTSRIILIADEQEPTRIEKLVIRPDPSSADQRSILTEYSYLQKGIVTPDTR